MARRDLRHARGRFVLMTAVIVMVTLLVGFLSGLTEGLARDSTSAVTGLRADRLVFGGTEASFATSRVPTDGSVPGEPIGFATTRASGAQPAPVTVVGVRPDSPVAAAAARVRRGTLVLSTGAAADLGTTADGELRIAGHRYRVAAVQGDASFGHVPVVWMALADWQQATDAGDSATVLARAGTDAAQRAGVPSGYLSVPLAQARSAIGSFSAENGSLRLIRGLLFAISAMVVGAFFTVWTMQRSRDIAVLKALGASSSYLVRDALGQAALVLATGIGLGAAVVAAAGRGLPGDVPFVLDPATLGLPLAVLGLLGLAGAAVAVRRITAVDPLAALGSAR